MPDPLGLINSNSVSPRPSLKNLAGSGAVRGVQDANRPDAVAQPGPAFKDMLLDQLREVNTLEQEATQAIEDLQTGKRTDYDAVMTATRKADLAMQMLLQLRNKVVDAYQEVGQVRV